MWVGWMAGAGMLLCFVFDFCKEGLICFAGAQLVGLVEQREIRIFRIFWFRVVLDKFIFGKTHTSPEVAHFDDQLRMRPMLKSGQILKPNGLKNWDLS